MKLPMSGIQSCSRLLIQALRTPSCHTALRLAVSVANPRRSSPPRESQKPGVDVERRFSPPHKHLFVATKFSRFPPRQIRYLRVTSTQGFWADREAGESSELACVSKGAASASLRLHRKQEGYLARNSPHQNGWFGTSQIPRLEPDSSHQKVRCRERTND